MRAARHPNLSRARTAALAAAIVLSGCAGKVERAEPLPDDWTSEATAAGSMEPGGQLWRDIVATSTGIVAHNRTGPNSAARFYAHTTRAAWHAWQTQEEEHLKRGSAAWAAAEAGARTYGGDPDIARELSIMALRHSTGDPEERTHGTISARKIASDEEIQTYRELVMINITESGGGEWDWEPTWPERLSFQFPGWSEAEIIVEEASVCTLPPPPLEQIAQEAMQIAERVRAEGPGSYVTARVSRWLAGPGSPTPPGQWLQIAADAPETRSLTEQEGLQLIALMSIAAHDTSILTWKEKLRWNLARPETMLARWGEQIPLAPRPTPNHPAYPSAHSSFSASAATVLMHLVGDMPVRIPSPQEEWAAATLPDLASAVKDASQGRVDAGFHYPADTHAGEKLGECVARTVLDEALGEHR